eukprot:1867659-Rhodomonas_salina.1
MVAHKQEREQEHTQQPHRGHRHGHEQDQKTEKRKTRPMIDRLEQTQILDIKARGQEPGCRGEGRCRR